MSSAVIDNDEGRTNKRYDDERKGESDARNRGSAPRGMVARASKRVVG